MDGSIHGKAIFVINHVLLLQTEGDELTWVQRCKAGEDVILGHSDGTVARYKVDKFRPMGKTARGLQASKLQPGTRIMGISTLQQASWLEPMIHLSPLVLLCWAVTLSAKGFCAEQLEGHSLVDILGLEEIAVSM